MHAHGVRRVLAVVTSAYASYSGCRQYREEIATALAHAGITDMQVDKVPPFNEAPGFIRANAEALMQEEAHQWPGLTSALATLADEATAKQQPTQDTTVQPQVCMTHRFFYSH